jgi:hypothetical protein
MEEETTTMGQWSAIQTTELRLRGLLKGIGFRRYSRGMRRKSRGRAGTGSLSGGLCSRSGDSQGLKRGTVNSILKLKATLTIVL